jgi:hypothetical protein
MNPTMIIMGVVIVLLFYMYFFYNTKETVITQKLDLTTAQPEIPIEKIVDPGAARYSYELWVFVNQYSGTKQDLFYRSSEVKNGNCTLGTAAVAATAANGSTPAKSAVEATAATFDSGATNINNIGLSISGTSPSLVVEYVKNNKAVPASPINLCEGARQANEKGTLVVTDNFPVQTWVHVIVSVDNAYIDTYINGKLTKSILEKDGIKSPSAQNTIKFGLSPGTTLAKLTRFTTPIDPQTAWDKYSSGNGANMLSKYLGTLGMDVSLKKDNVEYSKLNIF